MKTVLEWLILISESFSLIKEQMHQKKDFSDIRKQAKNTARMKNEFKAGTLTLTDIYTKLGPA